MESQIHNALAWRYATQVFDQSKKLTETQVRAVLEAGRLAPSSFGLEAWKFIVVENPEVRARLRKVSNDQPKVTDASHVIVIARRTDVKEQIVKERIERTARIQGQSEESLAGYKEMLDGVVEGKGEALDQWIKCQTYIPLGMMMEAASLLQIDNAAMEGFDPANVDEVLGLKELHLASVSMLALGYRGEDAQSKRPKVRRAFDEVVTYVK